MAIELLVILKKYFSLNKKRKEEMFCLIKKVFLFFTQYSNFMMHLLYYPQMSVFSFHAFIILLYQFLRHGA